MRQKAFSLTLYRDYRYIYRKSLNRSHIWIKACLKLAPGLPAILSIDAGLEMTPSPYPHSQVKNWDEATTVTHRSTLQLLMAGRITRLLREACDPRFPRFSSPQQHVCRTGWYPHSWAWASLQYMASKCPCKRDDPGSRCCTSESLSLAKPLGVAVNHVHASKQN